MRRSLLVFTLALFAAAALSAGALAKEGGVELSSTPFGTKPGDPWTGTLTLVSDDGLAAQAKPSMTIRNLGTGETHTFTLQPAKVPTTAHAATFVYEVVFPKAGRYRYTVRDGVTDREYNFPVVRIVDPAVTPIVRPGAEAGGDSFPLWPLIGGLGGAALLAAAALLALRGRRFGLSH